MNKNPPIAMLFSGGVDSSVALSLLSLLKEENLTAFYIKVWLQDEFSKLGNCPWEEDLDFAQKVCQQLGIKLEVIPLQKEYWELVVEDAIEQIKLGNTPNPDVYCNSKIKFGKFLEEIGEGYRVASGHYAGIQTTSHDEIYLRKSLDPIKDQTYFLSYLQTAQLKRCIFPLGGLSDLGKDFSWWSKQIDFVSLGIDGYTAWQKGFTKKEVRQLATLFNLASKNRKDSQGVCFLGKIKFHDFIQYHLGEKKGKIIEWESGKCMGEHLGYWYYTIGQRQGLGLSGGPWYVVEKNIEENLVFISHRNIEYQNLKRFKEFQIIKVNWINKPEDKFVGEVKVRHGERSHKAKVIKTNNSYQVVLEQGDWGMASGQFAALYKDDICLGSGIIKMNFNEK